MKLKTNRSLDISCYKWEHRNYRPSYTVTFYREVFKLNGDEGDYIIENKTYNRVTVSSLRRCIRYMEKELMESPRYTKRGKK